MEVEICDLIKELKNDNKNIWKELDNRVKFSTFTWILGILLVIVLGILGIIYSEVKATNDKIDYVKEDVSEVQSSVSQINGFLAGAEIINE